MRAVQVKEENKNDAESLHIAEVADPTLKDDEVLVQVKAFGLNIMDLMQRKGGYPLPPGASPILGVEFSGIIETANGKWKKGDEVFGLVAGGCYAEKVAVNSRMIWSKPECLSWALAAAIPEQWLTAYQTSIAIGKLSKGETILVHAGASGVGTSAIQLARKWGASKIFTTAGTKEKCAFLTDHLKATKAFNYKEEDWSQAVLDATDGKGVDLVLDFVGASYWNKNINALARDGRMVMIGLMGGANVENASLGPILFKRLKIEGTTLRSRTVDYQVDLMARFEKEALSLIIGTSDGTHKNGEGLDLIIHKVYKAEEIVEATKAMEGAHNTGKLICEW